VRISIRGKLIATFALLILINWFRLDYAAAQGPFDMSPIDTTIFAPDSTQVIGHGHYNLSYADGLELIHGEDKYLDGEYDQEEQRLKPAPSDVPPFLLSYQHRFFNADGTPQYEESLDSRSGAATCKFYSSDVPDLRESILKVPADTYSGATQLLLLVGRLRQGASAITFHSFNCIPNPRIIAVKATPQSGAVEWPMYPGKLAKLEMEPDLGMLNVLIAPFIPKVFAWFDPADSFNYVGGQFDRYYKGRHVLMVRSHDSNPVAQGPTSPQGH
jgi:hypothetical protein